MNWNQLLSQLITASMWVLVAYIIGFLLPKIGKGFLVFIGILMGIGFLKRLKK